MAVAIIKYNLNDPDDEMDFARANASLSMACFIFEILNNGKRRFKDNENVTIDDVWEYLWQEARDNGVDIDKLIQ